MGPKANANGPQIGPKLFGLRRGQFEIGYLYIRITFSRPKRPEAGSSSSEGVVGIGATILPPSVRLSYLTVETFRIVVETEPKSAQNRSESLCAALSYRAGYFGLGLAQF